MSDNFDELRADLAAFGFELNGARNSSTSTLGSGLIHSREGRFRAIGPGGVEIFASTPAKLIQRVTSHVADVARLKTAPAAEPVFVHSGLKGTGPTNF